MVQDESADPSSSEPPRGEPTAHAPRVSRALLLGGVAAACLLGAGVGLWARPSELERPGASKAQPTAMATKPADRRLAIVVDDTPAPVGKPLDVLSRPTVVPPTPLPPLSVPAAPPAAPEPMAPKAPPSGLVRVAAPVPGPLAPALQKPPAPLPVAKPAIAAAPRPAEPKAVPKPATRVAQAEAPKPKLKPQRLAANHAASHKSRPPREAEVADVAPAPKPRHGLSVLTHALAKLAPHHAPAVEPAPAEAKPARKRKPEPESRLAKAKPRPARAAPVKVASASQRCTSADPGEALACGDPNLGAAERRMNRAYRDAEAAGVPAATLERQQQRWRAARAAAAREAPWAVRDVYQARIAELQDLAREAKAN
ncbi:hypothetical protein [Phenylobacterium soli]|uniref:Lysozyme inhibitor LprI N-terminal domain-containing protein n=1 Tax=Phenylobacterium soli TaxID=2170551 RepID=A0A328AI30_9CAUL|nr:hypothetical protein [Phenylobacterium soli]RAK53716.1 hypothetical protein DJ017_03825 [Phenylobacterium soli]